MVEDEEWELKFHDTVDIEQYVCMVLIVRGGSKGEATALLPAGGLAPNKIFVESYWASGMKI